MTTEVFARIGSWFAAAFHMDDADQAQAALADATRWGWLPALSGVPVDGVPVHGVAVADAPLADALAAVPVKPHAVANDAAAGVSELLA